MIPLGEINNLAEILQVPAETIEKDYVISWILYCFSQSKLSHDFIFYGGTAIKRIYFDEHRFSEDIDLISHKRFDMDYLLSELTFETARDAVNLELEFIPGRTVRTSDRIQLYVGYSAYDQIINSPKEVRLDFSMNRELFGDIVQAKVISSYSDFDMRNDTLSVMSLNSILGNKLGLLFDLTRNEPRDVFDIWFLLNRTNKFDFNFDSVCRAFKEKYGFIPSYGLFSSHLKSSIFQANWEMRLGPQVANLPEVQDVIRDIRTCLKSLFDVETFHI